MRRTGSWYRPVNLVVELDAAVLVLSAEVVLRGGPDWADSPTQVQPCQPWAQLHSQHSAAAGRPASDVQVQRRQPGFSPSQPPFFLLLHCRWCLLAAETEASPSSVPTATEEKYKNPVSQNAFSVKSKLTLITPWILLCIDWVVLTLWILLYTEWIVSFFTCFRMSHFPRGNNTNREFIECHQWLKALYKR